MSWGRRIPRTVKRVVKPALAEPADGMRCAMQRRLRKTSNHPLEVFVKKNERVTHELEENVAAGVAAARDWATPHVTHAYDWAKPRW